MSYLIAIGAVDAGGWSRDITPLGTQSVEQYVFKPFELVLVSGGDDHVFGLCVFVNARPGLIVIDGTETAEGEFYPYAVLEVANDRQGQWQTVGPAPNPGKKSTLPVEARRPSKNLVVDLDLFRPLIRKSKYGRIPLTTGESAVFNLEKLLPPAQEAEQKHHSIERSPISVTKRK
jgi:hypothetical protein